MNAKLETLPGAAAIPAAIANILTFAFCKRHGVLVQRVVNGVADAVYRAGAQPASVAEVRRVLGMPLQMRRVDCGSLRPAAAATI